MTLFHIRLVSIWRLISIILCSLISDLREGDKICQNQSQKAWDMTNLPQGGTSLCFIYVCVTVLRGLRGTFDINNPYFLYD